MTYTYSCLSFFFLHHPAPTDIYTLSLHDALPIRPTAAYIGTAGEAARPPPEERRDERRTMSDFWLRSLLAVVLGAWLFVAGCDRARGAKAATPPVAPAVVVSQVVQRDAPILREFVARTEA